ncbi:MAG: WYL domain-containing protein [Sphingorhabdus sp.]
MVGFFAGWCELRKDLRTFRLDRITAIEETGGQFPDNPSQNLQAYFANKIFAVETQNPKA